MTRSSDGTKHGSLAQLVQSPRLITGRSWVRVPGDPLSRVAPGRCEKNAVSSQRMTRPDAKSGGNCTARAAYSLASV